MQRDSNGWIDPAKHLPENMPGKDYSANVLALVEYRGKVHRLVMAYIWAHCEDVAHSGYVWANCCGNIDGEAEHDDDYNVIGWQPLPTEALGEPVPPAFTFKALEWAWDERGFIWSCEALGFRYTCTAYECGMWVCGIADLGMDEYASEEWNMKEDEAKASCQAHHEGQLLKFLNPVT